MESGLCYSPILEKNMNNNILESVKILINSRKCREDKTFPAVIHGKDGSNYQIPYEGILHSIPNALPCDLSIGQLVWVKIPSGELRNMHICGLRTK
jgi:hypothetical protein